MNITNNSTVFPVTAVADTALGTVSQYTPLQGTGAGWGSSISYEVSYSLTPNRLIVQRAGLYKITGWVNISTFPGANALIGINYLLNNTTHGTRPAVAKGAATDDRANLFFTEYVSLAASTYVQMSLASSQTGDLVIKNASLDLQLIRGA